ncbi:MAG: pyridoxamine 5'-phosphate oxidase family protein [Saprospirales bacterium]|nr:pyridoxamine 5'-phosphate oxidase family protein [Saprospirales bacterium]
MSDFPKTPRTTITRLPKRGEYDKETIYAILDEALYCTLAYVREGQAFQIPTGFCRIGDKLYIHGSVGSFYMREIAANNLPVSIGVTHIDGLVLARSAFHHSVNYRSVVLFSQGELVTEEAELYTALEAFTEKMCPGRWADIRKPSKKEWKATMVISFRIEEASAKIRTGPPKDDEEDYDLDVWAGVLPLELVKRAVVPDPELKEGVELPEYLAK